MLTNVQKAIFIFDRGPAIVLNLVFSMFTNSGCDQVVLISEKNRN